MALDGIVIANIVSELKQLLLGGRIDKIYQPESDEIQFTLRNNGKTYRLLMTAHPSHPRIHITNKSKDNPITPPMFCMLMRKHIAGGKLVDIVQHDFERIIELYVESLNELGDLTCKKIVIEIMGRHSNIILVNENGQVIDSIKHISRDVSSVREVLPGRSYVLPPSQNKLNPLDIKEELSFKHIQGEKGTKIQKALYLAYSGISPVIASEICYRAQVDSSTYIEELEESSKQRIYEVFQRIMENMRNENFTPNVIKENTYKMVDFSSIPLEQFQTYEKMIFDTISEALEYYYYEKDQQVRINQKSHDLRKLITNNLERAYKKKDLQLHQLEDTKDREKWRIKGELLTANIYAIPQGTSKYTTVNYYDEAQGEITISLDPTLSPAQNAQKYFNKYNKAKRTNIALIEQLKQTNDEIEYLESVLNALEASTDEADIEEIRSELSEEGYIRKRKSKKGNRQKKSKPLHFLSSDGFDLLVGKNNNQNDELTLRIADSTDLWFHTKEIPGSHVIIRTNQKMVPDQTILEAAQLAAYFSKAKHSSNVPVDYTIRKNVKKPNGAKPGFVIYERNKTVYVTPIESIVEELKK